MLESLKKKGGGDALCSLRRPLPRFRTLQCLPVLYHLFAFSFGIVVVVAVVVVTRRLLASLRGRLFLLQVRQLVLALLVQCGHGVAGEPALGLRGTGARAGGHVGCGSVGDR